jgi:hypothetical protein
METLCQHEDIARYCPKCRQIQRTADYETLLLLFYQTVRENGGKTNHAPSAKQILFWIDLYGFACTEQGIRRVASFLKRMPDGVIRTDSDALYLNNYLNVAIKSLKESIAPARTEPEPEPSKPVCPCGGPRKGNRPDGVCLKCGTYALPKELGND